VGRPPAKRSSKLVSRTLRDAIADARKDTSLKCRLGAENRRSSQLVRDRMRASW
jgi:malonate decarboxylase gamma subunit